MKKQRKLMIMMLTGILLAIVAGLFASTVGVVLSYFSRSKLEITQYFLANFSISGILALLLYCDFGVVFSGQVMSAGKLSLLMIASGLTNSIGILLMQSAMKRGHNSVAWSIGQSALVVPFLFGVFVFHQGDSIMQFIGVGLILCGMLFPLAAAKKNSNNDGGSINWLFFALGAFLLFGAGQTLGNIPSYWTDWKDNANLRPSLPYIGSMLAVVFTILIQKKKIFHIDHKTLIIAALISPFNVISVKMVFIALDNLSACGVGSIGYPIMIGTCISVFSLYSLLVMKEKNLWVNWLGLAGTVSGIVVLSIK